ncbi:MAG: class I SAM-dependent methyltransferase [Patescibacteria group bacterium]
MNLVLDTVQIETVCAERWRYLEAPLRPCRAQLRIWGERVDDVARGLQRPSALCLGSTPELRDLLLERGFALTVLDPNDDVYGFMTELMEHPRHPNEMYEKLDWRDADFVPGTFDVVLSDLLLFHLPDRVLIGELYERLHTWMASGGVVLTREIISLPANRFPSCADLVVAWRRGEIQNPSDLSHLLIFANDSPIMDERREKVDGRLASILLHALKQKNIISAEEYEMLSTVALPWQGIAHRREDLRLSMEQFFRLESLHPCQQFISCQTMPLWQLINS